ncbi:D-glutamate deacylase [Algoriphagus lacus]|uniref:D-glutamate deacylase n=1 Tax=Algoriphagus lacus TaxID=2056311 RepID=A0A418PNV6_9BACT|nr:amidohydrolase family protein [Algoriphagus lacus]RIW13604.1 D-glutamate deacylase [Algoriphagus lacus]
MKATLSVFTALLLSINSFGQTKITYDLVLSGGRVIDPETKLDEVRNVGIIQNRIAEISSEPLQGKEILDVTGLVVAPGFIDLHIHGRTNVEQEYQLHDGVTTALELEWGIENLGTWYETRKSKALINYGASVNWPFERYRGMAGHEAGLTALDSITKSGNSQIPSLSNIISNSFSTTPSQEEFLSMVKHIKASLAEGGLGIGAPIGYLPQTKPEEFYRVFELAAEMDVPVFVHTRQPNLMTIQEAISNAMLTKASLHLVHINSMSLGNIGLALELVHKAQSQGFDITTELYPYTAASTSLESAMFDPGWQVRMNISYQDLQWVATGERLTEKTFDEYRKTGGTVIIHMMKPEWINQGISSSGVLIGSDGMNYAKLAHPRTAGTFSRVLGKYVREDKVIDLLTALEKMTLLPARRLENIAPMMRFKGRVQVGADADLTIFNPNTVIDKATFEKGLAFSEGIEYVLVNGTFVLRNGKTVSGVMPGQPIYGKFKK